MPLPIVLMQKISEYLDLPTQFIIIRLNQETNRQIKILHLIGYDKKINASDNEKIKCVSHMTTLEILHIGHSKISDLQIKNLNLKELHAYFSSNIKDINHMTKLEILNAEGDNGIDDQGIKKLNLKEL